VREQTVQVELVPAAEVGELVVGRKVRMRLVVALLLRDLDDRLPTGTRRRVVLRDRLPDEVDVGEHEAAADVAVVRDRERLAAGVLLVRAQHLPEVLRIRAVELRERPRAVRLGGAVAEDDDTMDIVAAGHRRPLVADERTEAAGLVVGVGRRVVRLPRRAKRLGAVDRRLRLGERSDDRPDRLERRVAARADALVPLPADVRA
jgi:hypothetical protein